MRDDTGQIVVPSGTGPRADVLRQLVEQARSLAEMSRELRERVQALAEAEAGERP